MITTFLSMLLLVFSAQANPYFFTDGQLSSSMVSMVEHYQQLNPSKVKKDVHQNGAISYTFLADDGSVAIHCLTDRKSCAFYDVLSDKKLSRKVDQSVMEMFALYKTSPWLSFTESSINRVAVFEKRHPVMWADKSSIQCIGYPKDNELGFANAECGFEVFKEFPFAEANGIFDWLRSHPAGSRARDLAKDPNYKLVGMHLTQSLSGKSAGLRHFHMEFRSATKPQNQYDVETIYLRYDIYDIKASRIVMNIQEFISSTLH